MSRSLDEPIRSCTAIDMASRTIGAVTRWLMRPIMIFWNFELGFQSSR